MLIRAILKCVYVRARARHKPSACAQAICPRLRHRLLSPYGRPQARRSHKPSASRAAPDAERHAPRVALRKACRKPQSHAISNPKPQTPNRNPKPETVQAGGRRAARATRYQPVRGDAPMYIYISDTCKPGQHAISQYEVMHLCCCCWAAADICRYSRHWPSFAALLPFLCVLSLLAH